MDRSRQGSSVQRRTASRWRSLSSQRLWVRGTPAAAQKWGPLMNERERKWGSLSILSTCRCPRFTLPLRGHRLQISRRGPWGGPSDLSLAHWLRCATANVEMGAAKCLRHSHRGPRVLGPLTRGCWDLRLRVLTAEACAPGACDRKREAPTGRSPVRCEIRAAQGCCKAAETQRRQTQMNKWKI